MSATVDSEDKALTAEGLLAKYGAWGHHPVHPLADWQREVTEDNTRLGYWEWVEEELKWSGK